MMEAMAEPEPLEISIDFSGRDPVIVLTGYVDQSTAPQLRDALTEVIERSHDRVTLDVEGVTFIDSSGIGALAAAYKRGAHVTVRHPSPTVMRELVMCGLDRLIAIMIPRRGKQSVCLGARSGAARGRADRSRPCRGTRCPRGGTRGPLAGRTPMGYIVTRHEDVTAILRDRRFLSALSLITQMQGVDESRFVERRRQSILSVDGDEHARLRRLVAPAFTPKSADRLRPFMREVINGLVDKVAPVGRCELVEDICEPYPIPIICELLGAPKEDWKLFSYWATRHLPHLQQRPRERHGPHRRRVTSWTRTCGRWSTSGGRGRPTTC